MNSTNHWELTDSAKAARIFFETNKDQAEEILKASRVGKMLVRSGFEEEIDFIAGRGKATVVPWLKDGKMVVD